MTYIISNMRDHIIRQSLICLLLDRCTCGSLFVAKVRCASGNTNFPRSKIVGEGYGTECFFLVWNGGYRDCLTAPAPPSAALIHKSVLLLTLTRNDSAKNNLHVDWADGNVLANIPINVC